MAAVTIGCECAPQIPILKYTCTCSSCTEGPEFGLIVFRVCGQWQRRRLVVGVATTSLIWQRGAPRMHPDETLIHTTHDVTVGKTPP